MQNVRDVTGNGCSVGASMIKKASSTGERPLKEISGVKAIPAPFDPILWAQLNPWLAEGQADDRTPMDGSVKDSPGTPSAQRAFARRSHQLMFKKWSQTRHD
jgi:hypothetical protein